MTYIAFEGIDGSGKSTQYEIQVERLKGIYGEEVKEYAYSSKDNPVGRIIRRAYKQGESHPLSFLTNRRAVQEALYAINARHNLRKVNSPQDGILVSDRSVITAYASHIDLIPEWFLRLAEPNISPDLAIFIDVPPEVGFDRISNRETLLAEEDLASLELFRRNYHKVFNERRPRNLRNTTIEVVDGNRPIEEVTQEVSSVMNSWIGRNYKQNGRQR